MRSRTNCFPYNLLKLSGVPTHMNRCILSPTDHSRQRKWILSIGTDLSSVDNYVCLEQRWALRLTIFDMSQILCKDIVHMGRKIWMSLRVYRHDPTGFHVFVRSRAGRIWQGAGDMERYHHKISGNRHSSLAGGCLRLDGWCFLLRLPDGRQWPWFSCSAATWCLWRSRWYTIFWSHSQLLLWRRAFVICLP